MFGFLIGLILGFISALLLFFLSKKEYKKSEVIIIEKDPSGRKRKTIIRKYTELDKESESKNNDLEESKSKNDSSSINGLLNASKDAILSENNSQYKNSENSEIIKCLFPNIGEEIKWSPEMLSKILPLL